MIIETPRRRGYQLHAPDSPEAEALLTERGLTRRRPRPRHRGAGAHRGHRLPDHRRHQRRRRVRQPQRAGWHARPARCLRRARSSSGAAGSRSWSCSSARSARAAARRRLLVADGTRSVADGRGRAAPGALPLHGSSHAVCRARDEAASRGVSAWPVRARRVLPCCPGLRASGQLRSVRRENFDHVGHATIGRRGIVIRGSRRSARTSSPKRFAMTSPRSGTVIAAWS